MGIIIVAVLVFIFLIVLILKSIKVVPQSKVLVVFQLGRLKNVCLPGFHVITPFIETGRLVDLGRQTVELKSQQVSILDSSPVNMTSVIGFQIRDPAKTIQNVADYKGALTTLSETQLRRYCSEITLAELLTERPKLQERILESLNRDSQEWGIQVNDFVINFIDVPEEVQNDLRRQAEKERLRRLTLEK